MKMTIISLLLTLVSISTFAQSAKDSVTIKGRVTDYNDKPLDSVYVGYKHPDFSDVGETLTDKDGYYSTRIKKGKYFAMAALRMSEYPITGSILPEQDQRLEFWAWDFIADRDTTFNIQYHRMEAYGINVFYVKGGTPHYIIYVRPMSLTRFQKWSKDKTPEELLAPSPDKAEIKVTINGVDTPVRMIQEVKEYFEDGVYGNAYLITVDRPKTGSKLPYDIFRVQISDLENGDKGEGIYFKEKEKFE